MYYFYDDPSGRSLRLLELYLTLMVLRLDVKIAEDEGVFKIFGGTALR